MLTDYASRRMDLGSGGEVSFARRGGTQQKTLRLQDIGMGMDPEGDEGVIADTLALVRSLIQRNPTGHRLIQTLEGGERVVSHAVLETQRPDLAQVTTMILEEASSRSYVPEDTLFPEAALSIPPKNTKLQQLKEEVPLRAFRFVHIEIWVERLSCDSAQEARELPQT